MKSIGFVLLVLAVAVGARAEEPLAARTVTLSNGLTLLLAPDTTATTVDLAVWYPAGSGIEPAGQSGITHAVEHLMFRGSAHVPAGEHARRIQAEGGTANAVTTPDYTCTWQTLPPAALPLAFELEADRIAGLTFGDDALAAEKRAIDQERQGRAGASPLARGLEQLYLTAYPAHPYRWPVIGAAGDMANIDKAACQAWLQQHYGPERALVTVVGNFDPAAAQSLARRWLEPIPRHGAADRLAITTVPAAAGPRFSATRADVGVPVVAVGWQAPGDASRDALPLALLARMAAGRPGALLDRTLVQQKNELLAVQSGFDGRRQGTLLFVVAAARPGADSAAVVDDLTAAMEAFASQPPTAEALERARHQEETAALFSWQTARRRAEVLGAAAMVDGDAGAGQARLERLRALTPEDLQAAARRVLVPAHRTTVWISPTHRRAP